MQQILLADDDTILSELLTEYLQGEGYNVTAVFDGEAALTSLQSSSYDLMILDVMMPKKNGFDVLREMRTQSSVPVIMLTARGEELDRIVGLEMGADDYLPKPCNPRELSARIKAILRRSSQDSNHQNKEAMVIDDVELRPIDRSVTVKEQPVTLTSMEFDILHLLLRHAGEVLDKETISQQVMERRLEPFDRSIDMHISNLRKKLGNLPDNSQRIKTVRSIGYLYSPNANA